MSLIDELRRRHVFRVGIVYGAIAWVLAQAASIMVPAFHMPEWALTFIIVILLVGFPIALVLAWIFDLGPKGLEVTPSPLKAAAPSRRHLLILIGAVVVATAALGYLMYPKLLGRTEAAGPYDSIAVMPFDNLSGDPKNDYFSDGMSEELSNLLTRIPGLKVASRTSAFAYKGQKVDIRKVGRELDVETVLEGSVRKAGDQVRITAQLIDAESGYHIWSDSYDARLEEVFKVQDEISTAIVQNLKLELGGQEKAAQQAAAQPPTHNVEAYQLYLQGRYLWKRRGLTNMQRSIELYQRALSLDPSFARAHAGLASTYVLMPNFSDNPVAEQDEAYAHATTEARQALALDSTIAEAHAVLALIHTQRHDWIDGESGFFFATSLDPNDPTAHHWYSILLQDVGRLSAALPQAKRAYELDPTSPVIVMNLATVYFNLGRDADALNSIRTAEELGFEGDASGMKAMMALRKGDFEQVKTLAATAEFPPPMREFLGKAVDAMRDVSLRPGVLKELRTEYASKLGPDVSFTLYQQLDALDDAFALAENGHLDSTEFWGPESAPLRRDARFQELAKKLGLPEYWKQYGYPDGCKVAGEGIECE